MCKGGNAPKLVVYAPAPADAECTQRPALSDFKSSPDYPLLVTGNSRAPGQVVQGSADPQTQVDVNGPLIHFETDLFKGVMAVHFRGLPSTDATVFDGKKRTAHNVIQGKFKRPVAVDDLVTGQEFFFTEDNPPLIHGMLARMVLKAAAAISSSRAHIQFTDNYVCSMTPLASSCQILNVAMEGEEPPPMDAIEDARLLHPALADKNGRPLPACKRRKLLDCSAFSKSLVLGTEHVYTFATWLHHMDWERFVVDLAGFAKVDLCRWLPRGEPTLIMVKDLKSQEYVVNLSVWHERIVRLAEEAGQRKDAKVARAASGDVTSTVQSDWTRLQLW